MKSMKNNFSLFEIEPKAAEISKSKNQSDKAQKSIESLVKSINSQIESLLIEAESNDIKENMKIAGDYAKVIPALLDASKKLQLLNSEQKNNDKLAEIIRSDRESYQLSELLLKRISEISKKK